MCEEWQSLVCPHDATQAAQAVDGLDDRFDQNRVGSITVWQLTGGCFDLTEQFVGRRLFLRRHVSQVMRNGYRRTQADLRLKYARTAAFRAFAGLGQPPCVEGESTRSATRGKDIDEVTGRRSRSQGMAKLFLEIAALKAQLACE
jgi:hypothetical protein